jgi:polar amino acid transport system substrate-binding protein
MTKLKSVLTVVTCALVAVAMTTGLAAAQETLAKIKERGKIVVGVKADYRPWGFRDTAGNVVGMEIDMAQDVADRLRVKLEKVVVVASNRMEFLQQGKIDLIIATLGDTPKRREVIGIVEPNYYAGGANILAKKSMGFKTWPELKGKKVCGIQGAYYNKRVAEVYGAEIVAFKGTAEAETALRAGNCVAYVYDNTAIESRLAEGEAWRDYEMPLVTEDEQPWGVAVRLEDLNGPFGRFMKEVSVDWHKTGKLVAWEKKWGIKASPFLQMMHSKYK